VSIDLERNMLGFAPFSRANAMASAIMQGLDAEKVTEVRAAIDRTNEQFRKVREKQAAPASEPQRVMVPTVLGTRRRR
jgi:hypothetical protein